MKKTLIWLVLAIMAEPAMAAETWQHSESLLPAGLKMLGGLLIVLGIMFLLFYLSRKGLKILPTAKTGAIQVLETRYLMPKKALCLIKVRDRELLLGIGTERIELLTSLEPQSATTFADDLQASLEKKT